MKQKVALTLASGGARGVAHIGVIEVLEEKGYEISAVSGTSMGALVGGIYCTGKLQVYKEWMCELSKSKEFSLIDLSMGDDGLVKGERVLDRIKEMVPDMKIEDMKVPFACVATDIITGEEVVFDKGSLYEAIRASISIPTLFVPQEFGTHLLVDGGIVNPLPLNRVKRTEGDILFAVDLSAMNTEHKISMPKHKDGKENIFERIKNQLVDRKYHFAQKDSDFRMHYVNMLLQSSDIMCRQMTELAIQINKPDILIDIPHIYSTFEFYKSEEIVQQGREYALKAIAEYEKREKKAQKD